jgi:hypothetical protein
MPRKPLPPNVAELRGSYLRHPERRPRPDSDEQLPMTRLAEARITIAEPCPASVRDPRGIKLWEDTCARMLELGTLRRETIPTLERFVLFTVQMWAAIDAGKPIRAALNRELSALEERLLGAASRRNDAAAPARNDPDNYFAQFDDDPDEALRKADPKAWAQQCRRAAGEALKLAARLRFRPEERRRLLKPRNSAGRKREDEP